MGSIKIENLYKSYTNRRQIRRGSGNPENKGDEINVLEDINLEFEDGEMVCILGQSGCGKSTMLRIMAGFEEASSGRVLIDDKEVEGPTIDHIFMFQQNGLFPWMTVKENIELGVRHIEDLDNKSETIQEYIDIVELTGFENHYPNQLSGGMQRRAELARALAVHPEILFLDEPFTGLDYFTHLKIREEVINMHSYIGKTMVMVTHFIEDALIMADRIVILGERSQGVMMQRKINHARPRNIHKDPELRDLRDEVFMALGVSYVA